MEKEKELFLDVEESPSSIKHWLLFAIQHILAMLVACITVPLSVKNEALSKLVGYDVKPLPLAATLIAAGIGTLFYIFATRKKSPVFLSSSFAYIAPMGSALGVTLANGVIGNNFYAIVFGMIMVGIVYVAFALVIKYVGSSWLNKLLPPIIVGPVIMVIGLSLAGSAVSNLNGDYSGGYNIFKIICGLVALFATALASHYGKGTIKLIPFIIGMVSGYLAALIFTIVGLNIDHIAKVQTLAANLKIIDFTPLTSIFGSNFGFASIFNYKIFVPNDPQSFIFLRVNELKQFDYSKLGEIALIFVPVALVTMCEHIGDHKNLGNILNRDLLGDEPGLKNTLIGDGAATAISGALCGAANTTYGENVAVIGMTKIASVNVVILAALLTIVFGFFTPLTALLETIPGCVTGGVSLVLYGFIASSGVKMLINERIDFSKTKNIFIAAAILVAGIGGLNLQFGSFKITSIAVAMILGITLNLILKDSKEEKVEEVEEA